MFSCKDATKPASVSTLVSGQVTNPQSDTIIISKGEERYKIGMDSMGKFSKELTGLKEGMYNFSDGRERSGLYMVPGKNIEITVDTEQFDETISYKGDGAASSNYLAKKYMNEEEEPLNFKEVFSLDESSFKQKVDEITNKKESFFSSFTSLPTSFIDLEKRSLNFDKLSMLKSYESAHAHFTQKPEFKVSSEFGDPMAGIDLNNEEDFLNIDSYKSIVISNYTDGDIKDNIAKLDNIKSSMIKKEVVKNLGYYLSPGSEDLTDIYKGLRKHTESEEGKKELDVKYEQYQKLVKGQPSPSFEFVNRKGEMVSMEEMQGKNIYVDVWATWCGPCIREIPSLKELEKEYHSNNIEFVSISIDKMKDKEKWVKMIQEKELKGVQLFSDKDWKSDFVTGYGIEGIPRFILIDAEGNIVSADAPRPSSGDEIKGMFAEMGI